ncbi:MAG: cytochrome c family protein, partial [Alphaproteobacteria bacterium]
MRTPAIGAAAAALVAVAAPAAAQDAAKGEPIFRRLCFVCHAVGEGARNKVGPVLNGIVGRKAGTVEGFNYSPANRESAVVWTAEALA